MAHSLFQLAHLTRWPHGKEPELKWRIVETVITSEGPRTRMTSFVYATEVEASAKLEELARG